MKSSEADLGVHRPNQEFCGGLDRVDPSILHQSPHQPYEKGIELYEKVIKRKLSGDEDYHMNSFTVLAKEHAV